MAVHSNPADRLANVMRKIAAANSSRPIHSTLTKVLEATDDADFAHRVSILLKLPSEVENAVRASVDPEHDDVDWYLQWQAPVTTALGAVWNFTSAIGSVQQHFGTEHIVYLEGCGNLLRRQRYEARVEDDQYNEICMKIENLFLDVTAATDQEIPAELRGFLLSQLHQMRRALRDYDLRGAAALTEIFEQSVGASVTSQAVRSNMSNPAAESWITRYKNIVFAVGATAGVALSVLSIPAAVQDAVEVFHDVSEGIEQQVTDTPAELPTGVIVKSCGLGVVRRPRTLGCRAKVPG